MRSRLILQLFALVAIVIAGGSLFLRHYDNASVLRPFDYMQYWSAGRAMLDGRNPYDGATLYEYQRQIGTGYDDPIMMWNPPWTLPIAVGLGSVHWRTGQIAWFILNLAAIITSTQFLWRTFRGNAVRTPIAVLLAVLFAPTLFTLLLGQISGLLILGISGFLYFHQRQRPILAGLLLTFIAIKPHLFLPIAAILTCQSFTDRNIRRSILTSILCLSICSLIPVLIQPEIWSWYRSASSAQNASSNNTIHEWVHPTLGYLIRDALPNRPFTAMFIPMIIALPVTLAYWWKHRNTWSWDRHLPAVMIVSLIAAPYGAWGFDLVLLLVPVLYITAAILETNNATLIRWAGITYVLFNVLAILTLALPNSMTNYWIAPSIGIAYLGWMLAGRASDGSSVRPSLARPANLELPT